MSRLLVGTLVLLLLSVLAPSARTEDAPRGPGGHRRNLPLAKSDAEKRALTQLRAVRTQRGFQNVSEADGRLLRLLTESTNAKLVVEIGTSNGYSGIWIALGLRATNGKLLTHEIDPARLRMAQANFQRAGLSDRVTFIPGDAHQSVRRHGEVIDIVFLDADKGGYLDYLRKLLPLVRPGGLIVAHNMRYPAPDPAYIGAITQDPNLETSFLLMDGPGIAVTLKKR